MTLPALPPDWAPDDTPLASELNAVKAHAGYHVERLTTVLRRTAVQSITFNALNATNAISWQSVFGGYNGLGWALSPNPTRIPCPAGGDGRYAVTLTAAFAAAAGGFRYTYLVKNGLTTTTQPGLFAPGDATLSAWLATAWEVSLVAGDYLEIWVFQNRTAGTALDLGLLGDSPQVSLRRVEM